MHSFKPNLIKTLRLSFNDFFQNYKKDLIRKGNFSLFTTVHFKSLNLGPVYIEVGVGSHS